MPLCPASEFSPGLWYSNSSGQTLSVYSSLLAYCFSPLTLWRNRNQWLKYLMHISFYDTTEIRQTETVLLRKDSEPCQILLLHTATVKLRASLWICFNKAHPHSWQRLEGGLARCCKAQVSRWPVRPEGPGLPHNRRFFAPLRSSFRIFLCFLGSTITNSQRLSIYLKHQLQPSPRAKSLTESGH